MNSRAVKAVVLVAAVVAVFVSVRAAQNRAAVEFCDSHPTGLHTRDIEKIEGSLLLSRKGSFDPDSPGAQSLTFCPRLTMCTAGCTLEIEDHVVKSARYSSIE